MTATEAPPYRLHVRLDPRRAAELEALARANERSVAGEVRFILERALSEARAVQEHHAA